MKITILKFTDFQFKLSVITDRTSTDTVLQFLSSNNTSWIDRAIYTFAHKCLTNPSDITNDNNYYLYFRPTSLTPDSYDIILHPKLILKSRYQPHYRLELNYQERIELESNILHGEYLSSVLMSMDNSHPHLDITSNAVPVITYYLSHKDINLICRELIDEIGFCKLTTHPTLDTKLLLDIPSYLYAYIPSSPIHDKIGRYINS